MIRVRFLRSFDKSFSVLQESEKSKTKAALGRLLDYFSGGNKPLGLGLRQLRKPYWEIRISLDRRVLFSLQDDLIFFILVGNHDEIRRYL